MKKRIINIGDVWEVATSKGLTYGQVTHIDGNNGEVVRVLPGFHQERPQDLEKLVSGKKRFVAIIPLRYMPAKRVPIVANLEVPSAEKKFPDFRSGFPDPATGRFNWTAVYNGSDWIDVSKKDQQRLKSLPIHAVLTEATLIDYIERADWSWESEP